MALKDYFVYPTIRASQEKVLAELDTILANPNITDIVIEAPTGVGKSALGLTVAKYCGRSYIVTGTKQLQDQYKRDFPYIKTIKGRKNFDCLEGPYLRPPVKLTCDVGPCTSIAQYDCQFKPSLNHYSLSGDGLSILYDGNIDSPCHYFDQKYVALTANHAITNYKYFMALGLHDKDNVQLPERNLLVFDEAHIIEDQVIDYIEERSSFSRWAIQKLIPKFEFPVQRSYDGDQAPYDLKLWIEILTKLLSDLQVISGLFHQVIRTHDFTKSSSEKENWQRGFELGKFNQVLEMISETSFFVNKAAAAEIRGNLSEYFTLEQDTSLNELVEKLNELIHSLKENPDGWICRTLDFTNEKYPKLVRIRFAPLEVGPYLQPLYAKGQRRLFMSATILDKDTFCKMAGIDPSKTALIPIKQSDFPVQNRLVYMMNIAPISMKNKREVMPRIVQEIDSLMGKHKAQKGIIHVQSYEDIEIIKSILSQENRSRLISTTKVENLFNGETDKKKTIEEALVEHSKRTDASVLISPSMGTGVDLHDNLSRFQIVVKAPYGYLGDRWIAKKKELDRKWYDWKAIIDFIQKCGRSVRSKQDHAVTYTLDSNIRRLLSDNKTMVPQWFSEAIRLHDAANRDEYHSPRS